MTSIYTKTKTGWRLRAMLDTTTEETPQWVADLREYYQHSGEEVRVQSDAPAIAALARVMAYVEPEERRHCEEEGKPTDHIYRSVATASGLVSALSDAMLAARNKPDSTT